MKHRKKIEKIEKIERPKLSNIAQKCVVCNGFGTVSHRRVKCHACKGCGYLIVDQEEHYAVKES